jgi:hypothetical protein
VDTLKVFFQNQDVEQAAQNLVSACRNFPKHAPPPERLHLDLHFKSQPEAILFLACDDEGLRACLSSVRELILGNREEVRVCTP